MAKAKLFLSKKADSRGEHPILVRLDITRTNRPQFKSGIAVLPEYFTDGEIRIPVRSKLNAAFRDNLLRKKTEIEAFIASLKAMEMAFSEEVRTRKDILEVYEVVKSVNPAKISRTTIMAKKREQLAANAELVRQLQESRCPGVLEFVRKRLEGMKNGTIKRNGQGEDTARQKAVSRWLVGYAESRNRLDPVELKHTYREVDDIAAGAYDWKIEKRESGISL